jgi:hypothetical protein
MSAKKTRAVSRPAQKRREPSHADYSDQVSDAQLKELKRLASSKDKKDERWEKIDGPAW